MLKKSGPWGSGGSGYLPPNNGWGPPPSPPPGPCLANASGFQCGGLQGHGYRSAEACAALCCADPHCAVWQWAAAGQSKGGSGCWLGTQPISRSTCTNDTAWVGGGRPPPQPLPPPTHCAAAGDPGFPANASNVQCAGLTFDSKALSADTCAVNCCNDQSCAVWQFSNTTRGGGGCWRGTCQQPPIDMKGWIGGQRQAPSPPPAPPIPAPAIGGSYVGYLSDVADVSADFSLVIETMNNVDSNCAYGNGGWGEVPDGVNNLSFCLSQTVCEHHRELFVTHSDMAVDGAQAPRFVRLPPIKLPPAAGKDSSSSTCCFDMSLSRNSVYSLSTRDTAKKGQLRPGTRSAHVSPICT